MKRFLLLLIMFFTINNICFANDKTPINFVYIHGADQGTLEEFDTWINRMHPNMKKNLEKSPFVQEHLLKNAYIKEDKDMLYWADKTQKDRNIVETGLRISKKVSRCLAQFTRSTLAHLLHDAIWLQKEKNMQPILDELNNKIIASNKNGEKTTLVGYSAGTFITYEYMLHKIKAFNLLDFATKYQKSLELTNEDIAILNKINTNNTCIDKSLIANPNKEEFKNNLKKLNTQTQLYCCPDNAIAGVINFGSPTVIFYSQSFDESSQLFYINAQLYKYIIENNEFFLTANYKTDPLGVPSENITISSMLSQKGYSDIKQNGGFIYDTSVNGGINFISSHLKYWDQTNHFTKCIAKSYEEGYKYFYEINNNTK